MKCDEMCWCSQHAEMPIAATGEGNDQHHGLERFLQATCPGIVPTWDCRDYRNRCWQSFGWWKNGEDMSTESTIVWYSLISIVFGDSTVVTRRKGSWYIWYVWYMPFCQAWVLSGCRAKRFVVGCVSFLAKNNEKVASPKLKENRRKEKQVPNLLFCSPTHLATSENFWHPDILFMIFYDDSGCDRKTGVLGQHIMWASECPTMFEWSMNCAPCFCFGTKANACGAHFTVTKWFQKYSWRLVSTVPQYSSF